MEEDEDELPRSALERYSETTDNPGEDEKDKAPQKDKQISPECSRKKEEYKDDLPQGHQEKSSEPTDNPLESEEDKVSHTGKQVLTESSEKGESKNDLVQSHQDLKPENTDNSGHDNEAAVPCREEQCSAGEGVPGKMTSSESSPGPRVVREESGVQNNPSPLHNILKELGMDKYYKCKLSLQTLRTVDFCPDGVNIGPPNKEDLPWSILKQIMLLNKQCREDDIDKLAKVTQPKNQKKSFGKLSFGKNDTGRVSKVPHPMDVMQVLFMCSDYAVRQILARKLFLCRLAIPFIIPSDRLEVMLWPLRSIILEWKEQDEGKEDPLVKCKMNRVAFVRFGKNKLSKSSLMNDVLSSSGHATFFHKGSPCGKEKRVISNGIMEMSHFLPAGNKQDAFKQPALFFNLRGDACSHDIQRQVLMDLVTVLVIVVDIPELRKTAVQEILKDIATKKQERVVIVFTDNDGHSEDEIEELQELFCELIGDAIDKIDTVSLFDEEQQITSSLIQEVRETISNKMEEQDGLVSLEQCVASTLSANCEVDEYNNEYCRMGKEMALTILKEVYKVDYSKIKETFLPKQGECLTDLGKELRNLHRTCRDDEDPSNVRKAKEAIQKKIDSIRQKQGAVTEKVTFMERVISMFHEGQECREFARRWMQLELDDLSRLHLPRMNKEKNTCWRNLTIAREQEDAKKSSQLEDELRRIEENIESATCGWEHLMRELGQMYEVSLALKDSTSPQLSFLPELVGRQLLEGHPVELMDGDHGVVPIGWVKAVFQSLVKLAGNKKILVLSVLGIQSSGKSTMLNTMFGLEFAVSAGRCTRGIYAQLLPVKNYQNQRFEYLLVIDSEGLRSQQREKKYQYDNELATLVIGLSDVAMINMKGENITEMADVLEIVVHAFLRMKLADSPQKRQCMIIHQNVSAMNVEAKLADDRQKLQEQLNIMTKQASLAIGLSEAITTFNRIISFDSQQDVVYFPDLWSGDPPMAAINQGYSRQASDTQHTILHRVTRHFRSFISIEDFVTRAEDMWNGVLSDDFIFSFRNTLAAKAYIEVEKELGILTLKMEQELLRWVSAQCEPKIRNSESESKLEEYWTEIEASLQKQIDDNMDEKKQLLLDFFQHHSASEVVDQWKSEKMLSLKDFGKDLEQQIRTDLRNSKGRKMVQLRQNTDSNAQKEQIQKKAIDLAEKLRGKCQSPEDIQTQFDKLWENWASDLTAGCSQIEVKVLSTFSRILRKQFTSDEGKYLTKQLEATPLVPNEYSRLFTLRDITVQHIIVKDKPGIKAAVSKFIKGTPKEEDFFQKALEAANEMMKSILQKIDEIAKQDITFTALHGKETLDILWKAIDKHNSLSFEKACFVLTPQFKAMLAVRTSCIATVKFEKMSERYEDQYGVKAQMDEYKQQVFVRFKNAVRQASAEITAADNFCVVLKAEVAKQVREEVRIGLGGKIKAVLGNSKRDFIIAILDEIAETKSFSSLYGYVHDPAGYAEQWLKRYIESHLYAANSKGTNYSEYANDAARMIVGKIKSSISAATSEASKTTGENQYKCLLEEFCRQMTETVHITASQLQVEGISAIQDFDNFQSLLTSGIDKYHTELEREFQKEESVSWLDSQSEKIYKDMWGCKKNCPFCKEPCQFKDASHAGSHKCIQHKPQGVTGWHWRGTDRLMMGTCDFYITTGYRFQCCAGCECDKKEEYHDCKDYKKYFPKWDISNNPSGAPSKYWQWIMYTFQQQLQDSNSGKTLEINSSWRRVTPKEATGSLRTW